MYTLKKDVVCVQEKVERTEENIQVKTLPGDSADAVQTEVWECESNGCKGWMRKKFSLDETPLCPLCNSEMVIGTRSIPKLNNEFKRRGINFARRNRH